MGQLVIDFTWNSYNMAFESDVVSEDLSDYYVV